MVPSDLKNSFTFFFWEFKMPRRRVATKRRVLPDPKYSNELVTKFVNCVMRDGKKSIAEKVVYGALDRMWEKSKARSRKDEAGDEGDSGRSGTGGVAHGGRETGHLIELFEKALDNVRPTVEVRARRVGGSTYQIPVEVRMERQIALAMRWLVDAAKARGEKTMTLRLAGEMIDAMEGKGGAVKKREDTHRMARANQAFAHFRWN